MYTADLVIFACVNFREFLILRIFTKFRIHEFSLVESSAVIIFMAVITFQFFCCNQDIVRLTARVISRGQSEKRYRPSLYINERPFVSIDPVLGQHLIPNTNYSSVDPALSQ